jgi:hypothetical protein
MKFTSTYEEKSIRKKWLLDASLLLMDMVRVETSPALTVLGFKEKLVTSRVGDGGDRKVFKLMEKAIIKTKPNTTANIPLKLGITFTDGSYSIQEPEINVSN